MFQCNRLGGGMNKLAEASVQLAELNKKLVIQKAAVSEKSASCDALLKTIAEGTKKAQDKKVRLLTSIYYTTIDSKSQCCKS